MTDTYRFMGRTIPRRDAPEIVTGSIKYLNDIKVADMLFGKVMRSPHPHALIKRVDKSKAPQQECLQDRDSKDIGPKGHSLLRN